MKGYWSDTRPNGKPVEAGTVCWITDLEDGTHPIATYGKDQNEVFEKLARQNANAQITLARRAAQSPPQNTSGPTSTPAPARQPVSADRIMQATADLQNPAKAAGAVATLLEVHTGVNPEQQALENFASLAERWEDKTPDFFQHPGNKNLLAGRVFRLAGGKWGAVTESLLTQAFQGLQAEGLLFEAPEEPAQQQPTATLTTFPGETQAQRTERPRGTGFRTGVRSLSFGASQTPQTRTLKYSEEQIRTMPMNKQRELIRANDPDYAAACEAYFGARATA